MLEQAIKTVYMYLIAQIKTSCLALRQLFFFFLIISSSIDLSVYFMLLVSFNFFIDDELCLLFTLHTLQLQCVPSLLCEA